MENHYKDYTYTIMKPEIKVIEKFSGRALDYVEVRVVFSKMISEADFRTMRGELIPIHLNQAVIEHVLGDEEFRKYGIPARRLEIDQLMYNRKLHTLYYKLTTSKIEIKRVGLVVFSPTGSSMAVAEMLRSAFEERILSLGVNKDDLAGRGGCLSEKAGRDGRYEENGSQSGRFAESEERARRAVRGPVIDLCRDPDKGLIDEMHYVSDVYFKKDPNSGKEYIMMDSGTLSIFVVPCYGGRIPATAAERLSRIRAEWGIYGYPPAIVCVTYGNRAFEDSLLELSECVSDNGFRVIAGCAIVTEHNIMHEFGRGRPDVDDQAQIREFADKVFDKIWEKDEDTRVVMPGNWDFKEWGGSHLPIEVDRRKCFNCGWCAEECPVSAILPGSWESDKNLCINCMRCISLCPVKCRRVPGQILQAMTERLRAACEERKENVFVVGGPWEAVYEERKRLLRDE